MKSALFGAVVVAASAFANPALAEAAIGDSGHGAQFDTYANGQICDLAIRTRMVVTTATRRETLWCCTMQMSLIGTVITADRNQTIDYVAAPIREDLPGR